MKWTAEQQAAIESPRGSGLSSQTLLVAAAAGSGKTAVLVERIIQRLQDKDNPLSVDELLVMTFTRAAAAEMSARIGAKLADAYYETQDEYLEKQLSLLPSAHISTFDSFCQWVVRNYFYYMDMDPNFTIMGTEELQLLQQEVLEEVLLKAYEENLYRIYELAEIWGNNQSDERLRETVLRIHTFSLAQDNPKGWLRKTKEAYRSIGEKPLKESLWGQLCWDEQRDLLDTVLARYDKMKALVLGPGGPSPWIGHVEAVEGVLKLLEEADTWDEMVEAISHIDKNCFKPYVKSSKIFKEGLASGLIDPDSVAETEALGKGNKELLESMKDGVFALREEEWLPVIKEQGPILEGLIELVEAFQEALALRKETDGLMDFSDTEHACLRMLTEYIDEKGHRHPSAVARELQQTFKEVLVDEYQDTNGVQEAIVNLISREDNRFFVGDVKQSIYRFRLADPTLFMDKYHRFDKSQEAVERRIDLAKNFRSHENILKSTNFIFRQIMTEEAAELNYGDEEALYAGRVVENPPVSWVGGDVEVHIVEVPRKDRETLTEEIPGEEREAQATDEDGETLTSIEKEIQCIIEQIWALKNEKRTVQDKDGNFREMEWRDIVVLLRSLSGRGNVFVEAFRRAGIPAYAEEKSGYFNANEVLVMLALLQVVDNPEQDLPLAAVLRSPLVGLDGNELGRLRASGAGSLWQVLPVFCDRYNHEKVRRFLLQMDEWRTLARRQGVSELVWQVYKETGYLDYVSAMPDGVVRRANLMALYDRAKEYEATSFKGLYRFLQFLQKIKDSGQDLGVAKTASESDNVVRIMTIHKSKGLEFPIVFLATAQKKFNRMDLTNMLLLHQYLGIGMKGYYPKYRVFFPSLPWLALRRQLELAMLAEEERILYVALTRAKDKLFITGTTENVKSLCKKACMAIGEDVKLSKALITGVKSYLEWIMLALARHREGGNRIRVMAEADGSDLLDLPDKDSRWNLCFHGSEEYEFWQDKENPQHGEIQQILSFLPGEKGGLPAEVEARLSYRYPHETAVVTPAKISVTEIKRRFAEHEEEAESLPYESASENCEEAVLPAFAGVPMFEEEEDRSVSAMEYGTIMHLLMQLLPLKHYTRETLQEEIQKLADRGHFTPKEVRAIRIDQVLRFFEGNLAKRMLLSVHVERELSFSSLIEANRIYDGLSGEEQVFMQGVMDMAFLEDEKWVLVDYKTDYVRKEEELLHRYKIQLQLYKNALESLTGLPVKAAYIYSFKLGKEIEVK